MLPYIVTIFLILLFMFLVKYEKELDRLSKYDDKPNGFMYFES